MQYIPIKKTIKDNEEIYTVAAIALKNTNKTVVQKIPHPLGSETIDYKSLEEAKEAISLAGFSYILPDGQKGSKTTIKQKIVQNGYNYESIVLDAIKNKIKSTNSAVAAAAVFAISEFPSEETFDILFDKIGEDNEQIRKNAIDGICRYGNILSDRIIKALKSSSWVTRNSAISCIVNLAENTDTDVERFIIPLSETCSDSNTIVQANAICAVAKVYKKHRKQL